MSRILSPFAKTASGIYMLMLTGISTAMAQQYNTPAESAMTNNGPAGKSYFWVWAVLALAVLVVIILLANRSRRKNVES